MGGWLATLRPFHIVIEQLLQYNCISLISGLWADEWMTCHFTSFSIVFQSYQDYGWMDGWLAILRPFQQYVSHIRTMGRWIDDLRFYVLFNSISVISGLWADGWMTCHFTSFSTVFQWYQDYGRMGWMTCHFTSFSTVFQSYQDYGRMDGSLAILCPFQQYFSDIRTMGGC